MAEDGTPYKNGEIYYNTSPKLSHNENNNIKHEPLFAYEHESNISLERKYRSYSSEDSEDSPLDFSVKRKHVEHELSERESGGSAPSPSSTVDAKSFVDERKSTDPEDVPYCNGTLQDINDQHPEIGEIRSGSSPRSNQGLEKMLSAIHAGIVPPSAMYGVFPGMNSLMEGGGQNHKNTRPFKAYPKGAVGGVPFAGYGLTNGFNPFQGIDPATMQGLKMSNDELMTLYQRHLDTLRTKHVHNETSRLLSKSPQSTISSSSSPPATVTTNSILHNNIDHNSSNGSNISHVPINSGKNQSPALSSPGSSGLTASGRKRPRTLPDEQKDASYWERRRKNNEAAKRSRDARRAKEDEIAIRAALLEQENLKLRVEVAALKTETAKLRCMLYNS